MLQELSISLNHYGNPTFIFMIRFTEWPVDALERVAHKFLAVLDMKDDLRDRCVIMCKHFHESTRLLFIE